MIFIFLVPIGILLWLFLGLLAIINGAYGGKTGFWFLVATYPYTLISKAATWYYRK